MNAVHQPPTSPGVAIQRGLQLRCPRCGQGKLFKGIFTMHRNCDTCGLKFERAPGYFLGSAYINYGVLAFLVMGLYLWLHMGKGLTNEQVTPFLLVLIVFFSLFFFRYARSLWLAMDCYLDPTSFRSPE